MLVKALSIIEFQRMLGICVGHVVPTFCWPSSEKVGGI